MKKFLIGMVLLQMLPIWSQNDTIPSKVQPKKFNYKALVMPSMLVAYGIVGLENHQLLDFNTQIRAEVKEDIDEKLTIDDFSQYIPVAAVYGLSAAGYESRHNYKDRTTIAATSYLIMAATVLTLKKVSKVDRPDGTSSNSFPSGHTATAFAGAELLRQEYKDESIWFGISGYIVATGTGLFRMYNNRHWLTDVAAGAGIGILSTKIAYWIAPSVSKCLFGNEAKTSSAIAPFYNGRQVGVAFALKF